MFSVLLLAAAAAAGGPVALVLPADAAPDDKALRKGLEDRLVRKGLQLVAADGLVERPKALATAFRAYPTECWVTLNEAQDTAVRAVARDTAKGEELYVVLPTSDKVRNALVWRWDREKHLAMVVSGRKGPAVPPARPPERVVWLTVEGRREKTAPLDAMVEFVGADGYETLETDGRVVDALLEYPNECEPLLDDAATERLAALVGDTEGSVALAVVRNGEGLLWRWDGSTSTLRKVYTE